MHAYLYIARYIKTKVLGDPWLDCEQFELMACRCVLIVW